MESKEKAPDAMAHRPFWTGTISIGLVNIPIKLLTMTRDHSISFRLLHGKDNRPIRYMRVCEGDDEVVPWEDIVKGYEVSSGEYVVFEKDELEAIKPESDRKISLDKFIHFLSVDPVYFHTSYILLPDRSAEAYALLLAAFRESGKAGVGRITLRTKEYPALIRVYHGALILTTLHYANEILDPVNFEELIDIPVPGRKELDLAEKIIDDLTGDFDILEYRDSYMERLQAAIIRKMEGETIKVEKPKAREAKELMAALEETLEKMKAK
ncbi:MAG TPA: Ku protein [Methanoregulaceae archaeon]|nr:Ku protein [Methanoregulaceae archaeon]